MIDNIKKLYDKVRDKRAFIKLLADDFQLTESSITTNWLSTWSIPEYNQPRVHTLLIRFLKAEMARVERLLNDETED